MQFNHDACLGVLGVVETSAVLVRLSSHRRESEHASWELGPVLQWRDWFQCMQDDCDKCRRWLMGSPCAVRAGEHRCELQATVP